MWMMGKKKNPMDMAMQKEGIGSVGGKGRVGKRAGGSCVMNTLYPVELRGMLGACALKGSESGELPPNPVGHSFFLSLSIYLTLSSWPGVSRISIFSIAV